MSEKVLFFKRYPFAPGQKIHIQDGPRKGDWLVTGIDEKKVNLRCWDRFCYFSEEREAEFPARDK